MFQRKTLKSIYYVSVKLNKVDLLFTREYIMLGMFLALICDWLVLLTAAFIYCIS